MSYAVRNTLVIAAFWGLLLALGFYYVYGLQKKHVRTLYEQTAVQKARLEELGRLQMDRSVLQKEYDRLTELNAGKKGFIASHETPGETFDYIQRELRRCQAKLLVNLKYELTDRYMGVGRNSYELTGSGAFTDLYHLIWFLENGPLFYNITSLKIERPTLSIEQLHKRLKNEVQYTLNLNGYNRDEGPNIMQVPSNALDPQPMAELVTNRAMQVKSTETIVQPEALSPMTTAPVPEKTAAVINREGLPEIDQKTTVLAVTSQSALVRDQRGKTIRLRKGDPVFQGRVSEINPHSGQIVFEMTGVNRPVKLSLSTFQN